MGNRMAFQIRSRKQTRGPLIEEEEDAEFKASAPVHQINNGPGPYKRYILVRRKLQNGEVYNYLAPFFTTSVKPKVPCGTTEKRKVKTRKVRIVVTEEQLELLLSGKKKMILSRNRVFRSKKCSWKPSLPTIPELHNC